jgi:hypothetical protein
MKGEARAITNGVGGEQTESCPVLNIGNERGTFYVKNHTESDGILGKEWRFLLS